VQVHVTLPDGGASASDASSAATDAARPDDGGARDTGASDSAASDAATGRDAASALAQAGDAATRGDTVDAEVVATPPSTPTGADADASGEGPLAGSATPGQAGGCAVARPGGETGGLWAVAALVSTALGAARRRRRQASRA